MQRHFVTFRSPGTFFHEQSTKPIDSWNPDKAVEMARDIVERYNSRPFGFFFTTRTRGDNDLDSKESARSGFYYFNGTIRTFEQVMADNLPDEDILRSNMRSNGFKRIITTNTPWRSTNVVDDDDVVLNVTI
jgi:hypothetical protein